jgi:hypothetical protein
MRILRSRFQIAPAYGSSWDMSAMSLGDITAGDFSVRDIPHRAAGGRLDEAMDVEPLVAMMIECD